MRPRTRITASIATLACCATAAAALATTTEPSTVNGSVVTRTNGTPAPGSVVPSKDLGERVFVNNLDGFALAAATQSQAAAATTNGGKTWKLISPALHLDAAQAPLVVSELGAASRKTIFAYGGGQAVDVTTNGGATWYRALFQGLVESMASNVQGHLVVFEQLQSGSPVREYVSKNGGRTWTLTTALFGG